MSDQPDRVQPPPDPELREEVAEAIEAAYNGFDLSMMPKLDPRLWPELATAALKAIFYRPSPEPSGYDAADDTTEVPCGMCDATGVAPPLSSGACEWCDGAKTVEAMGEWVPRSRLEKAEEALREVCAAHNQAAGYESWEAVSSAQHDFASRGLAVLLSHPEEPK